MNEKNEILISSSDVIPGMIVSRDICTRNEQLLFYKGDVIDENGIAKISFYGILSIYVYVDDDPVTLAEQQSPVSIEKDLTIRNFNKQHEKSVSFLSENLNQLLAKNGRINEVELIKEVETVLKVTSNRYQVVDMLGYIQRFDDETYVHLLNVGLICNVFGDWLGMEDNEKRDLTLCGLLHDIGKLLVSKEILKKPGQLTDKEYQLIKEHPKKGYDFLKSKKISQCVKRAVLQHHERCDGNGYPDGISIDKIDSYAAITSIADVFEAMTSNRVYRKALCPFKVVRLFEEEGYKNFNPVFLIPILRKLTDAYLQHNVVLNDGREGKILLINEQELSRPSIICGNSLVDLMKERNLEIVKVME